MRRLLISSLVCILSVTLNAQGTFQDVFDEFSRKVFNEFESFRDKCNSDYAAFLETSWKSFNSCEAKPEPYEQQIPPVIYEANPEPDSEPVIDREIPIDDVVPQVETVPQPQPVEPIRETPVVATEEFEFYYLDNCLKVRAGNGLRFHLPSLSAHDISNAWRRLSGHEYDNLILDCLSIRDRYALCDWAYMQMLKAFAVSFTEDEKSAVLLMSYLYAQSGYKIRLGISKGRLYMLFGTKYVIYEKNFFQIDGTNFFVLDGDIDDMDIADCAFPGEQDMSLAILQEQGLHESNLGARHFLSDRYAISTDCSVNGSLIKFYDGYPTAEINDNAMTRWALYAETPVSRSVKDQLYPDLRKIVSGKSELVAADMLLDFVQNAFEYGYDDEIWGDDRAFFAEETLYYPYCDCEDRSILYSHLVRDLLDLDVLLVYYPGHLATAVHFNEPVAGDYLLVDQKKYTICDPTYIGAPVGETMPEMDNATSKVILLRKK